MRHIGRIALILTVCIALLGCSEMISSSDVPLAPSDKSSGGIHAINPGQVHNEAVLYALHVAKSPADIKPAVIYAIQHSTDWRMEEIEHSINEIRQPLTMPEVIESLAKLRENGQIDTFSELCFTGLMLAIITSDQRSVDACFVQLHEPGEHGPLYNTILSIADSSYALSMDLLQTRSLDEFNWSSYLFDDCAGAMFGGVVGGVVGGVAGAALCSSSNAYHQFWG